MRIKKTDFLNNVNYHARQSIVFVAWTCKRTEASNSKDSKNSWDACLISDAIGSGDVSSIRDASSSRYASSGRDASNSYRIPVTPARTSVAAKGTSIKTGSASQTPFTVERPEITASQLTAGPETSLTREKLVDKYFFYWPNCARYI